MLSLGLMLAIVFAFAGNIELPLEGVWVEDPEGKPVIDRGPEGAWDHVAVDNPFIYIEDGVFYCFYEGENERRQEQVGIAVSTDLLRWRKYEGNPVLKVGPPGAWDSLAAKIPVVARNKETYFLLYTGKDGKGAAIGVARSNDLRHWEKYPGNPVLPGRQGKWDPILTTSPSLIERDGVFYMIYRGMKGFYTDQKLGLAISRDLLHWNRRDKPLRGLDDIYSFAICPWLINGEYMALAQKLPPKHIYLSADLISWRRGPVLTFSAGKIDTPSQPILIDGVLWILYEKGDRIYRARFEPRP